MMHTFGQLLTVLTLPALALAMAVFVVAPQLAVTSTMGSADELVGLWKAKKRFGPDARGPLMIQKDGTAYIADMMGRRIPVRMDQGELTFDLPDNRGTFHRRIEARGVHQCFGPKPMT